MDGARSFWSGRGVGVFLDRALIGGGGPGISCALFLFVQTLPCPAVSCVGKPTMVVVAVQGPPSRNNSDLVQRVIGRHGAADYRLAANEQEGELIWQDRKNALFAGLAYQPGCKGWITDVW